MNPAKAKIAALHTAANQITPANRRSIVESDIRPILEALKSDWTLFSWTHDRFSQQTSTLETWATEIWKKADCEMKIGKFLAELQELESNLKS
jgi:hypothetical protein